MFGPALDRFATGVIRRRGLVIGVVGAITLALALQIPRIEADFTPSDLFAQVEDQERIAAEFQAAFGNTDNVVLVLIEAQDVLTQTNLQYLHDLSLHFRDEPTVERVESITVTPIPRHAEGVGSEPGESPPSMGGLGAAFGSLGRMMGGSDETLEGGLAGLLPEVRVDPVVSGTEVDAAEVEELREALPDAPLLLGKLIGHGNRVAAVALFLSRDLTRNDDIAAAMRSITTFIGSTTPPEGTRTLLAGLPYVRMVVVDKMKADQSILLPASLLVCLIILLLSFRWLPGVVVPTLAVGSSAAMLVGGMAVLGQSFNILNNIVPMLVLIIGISGSIHLVNRYGEELRKDGHKRASATRALRAMTIALFLTSFTTAVGFGSLLVSATPMLRQFGLIAAVGIVLAYLVSVSALPAGLSLARPPQRWRRSRRSGYLERLIVEITRRVIRLRWVVLSGAAVFFALTAFLATRLEVNSAVLDQLDRRDEIYSTTRLVERSLEGMRPLEVSLSSSREDRFDDPEVLNAMRRVQAWALEQHGVLGVTSYPEFLGEAWYRLSGDPGKRDADFHSRDLVDLLATLMAGAGDRNPVRAYVTPDRRWARINIQVADMGAKPTLHLIERLSQVLDDELGPLEDVNVALTGDAYLASMGLTVVVSDLTSSLLTAVIIIFGFLTLILRSPRLGLLSIPPNILPLVGTMAYMAVRGIPLNLATAIIFSVSLGMAVDGTIHVLARFREEIALGGSIDDALLRAARGTGKAIVFTCLSLMLGFGVMFLSSFPPVRRFGELISVTMGLCLVATLITVPALLKITWRGTVHVDEL